MSEYEDIKFFRLSILIEKIDFSKYSGRYVGGNENIMEIDVCFLPRGKLHTEGHGSGCVKNS